VKIEGGTPVKYLTKHLLYVVIGFVLMYWIHKRDAKNIYQFSRFAYVIAIGLLLFTLAFGAKVNDAGRWIKIPFVGLTFQSSDFAKYALIVYLARMMVKKKGMYKDWRKGFLPVMAPVVFICGLIVKDNFSTAFLLFLICLTLFFIGKVSFVKTTLSIASVVVLFGLVIAAHKTFPEANIFPRYETWENRISNKMDDKADVMSNAQALNAELAIYNGSILGEGVGDGKLKEYLPEAYADFYYASFVEEFGSFFAIVLVLCYLILLFRIFKIGIKSDRLFETYASVGIGVLLLTQASVNMLVCTGVFPVTGQNMPLLAMGGSALIMTCVGLGIIQSFAYRQEKASNQSKVEII
jgi:cell division protein FtsW